MGQTTGAIGVGSAVLTRAAWRLQRQVEAGIAERDRRARGQFGTPPEVAVFMSELADDALAEEEVRILDAGAGAGVLTAAVCDRIADQRRVRRVAIEAWENSAPLADALGQSLASIEAHLRQRGVEVCTRLVADDFILGNAGTLFAAGSEGDFDLAIQNPPYFKVRKGSEHARSLAHIVHGQPNMYQLFITQAVSLLRPGGRLVAITPRSYFNGPYFGRFREWLLSEVAPYHLHLFESRKEAFRVHDVLQENVILAARRGDRPRMVRVTCSTGPDPHEVSSERHMGYDEIVHRHDSTAVISVAPNPIEQAVLDTIRDLPSGLSAQSLSVSTGPVVRFRALAHLLDAPHPEGRSAPLLTLSNIRPLSVALTGRNAPREHVALDTAPAKLILPAQRYVVLRRFTSKEEPRRLVAAVVGREHSYSPWIGLENHLNYIHRGGGGLDSDEAHGLAALLSSVLFDRYLRAISGNTQVNASDLRALPLPEGADIRRLGQAVLDLPAVGRTGRVLEALVLDSIGAESSLHASVMEWV